MKKVFLLMCMSAFLFLGCSSDDTTTPEPTPDPAVTLDNPINDFTWKAMNSWYNWQPNVLNLADTKDDNQNDYYSYLNGFNTPQSLFESLLYDAGNTDRFSWFIEDYVAQQQAFQGITKSFGFRLQAVQIDNAGNIVFYVRYVSPDSPADRAGIKRGDIFNALDGVVLTSSNYSANVGKLSNETVTLTLVENDGTTPKEDKTITSEVVADNPVHFTKVFENIGGKKVGYLVYNGFRSSFNDELNTAFGELKAAGVQELILDLRLNGGGSVLTSAYLASMINASAGTDNFAELRFNNKHTNENGTYPFFNRLNVYNSDGQKTGEEDINRIDGLSTVYVLTSGSTASASEMIINGLTPFMNVKTVGTTTYGKNVGSITLYDSPSTDFLGASNANTAHKNAMQPIVFQIYNKNGESDYTQGFEPNIEVVEYEYWDNILAFGNENEVVLKAALDDIRGVATKSSFVAHKDVVSKRVKPLEVQFENEMYIDESFLEEK